MERYDIFFFYFSVQLNSYKSAVATSLETLQNLKLRKDVYLSPSYIYA